MDGHVDKVWRHVEREEEGCFLEAMPWQRVTEPLCFAQPITARALELRHHSPHSKNGINLSHRLYQTPQRPSFIFSVLFTHFISVYISQLPQTPPPIPPVSLPTLRSSRTSPPIPPRRLWIQ